MRAQPDAIQNLKILPRIHVDSGYRLSNTRTTLPTPKLTLNLDVSRLQTLPTPLHDLPALRHNTRTSWFPVAYPFPSEETGVVVRIGDPSLSPISASSAVSFRCERHHHEKLEGVSVSTETCRGPTFSYLSFPSSSLPDNGLLADINSIRVPLQDSSSLRLLTPV